MEAEYLSKATYTPVYDFMGAYLNIYEKEVLCYIIRMQRLANKMCYASQETMAVELGFSYDTVNRTIKKLLSIFAIKEISHSIGRGRSNQYIPNHEIIDGMYKAWLQSSQNDENRYEIVED